MMVLLTRTPSDVGYWTSTGHLLLPGKTSSGGSGLGSHSIELLAKGVLQKSPNHLVCCYDKKLLSANLQKGNNHITHWTGRSQVGTYMEFSPLPF